jgi:response regulator RpfG family c-di-GMP phosphodiesterase
VRPFYRASQFFRAFRRVDVGAIRTSTAECLSAEQTGLFGRMSLYDQQHAVDVLGRLRAEGHAKPELMQAALLHDAGKAFIRANLWRRVAHVLLWAVRTEADTPGEYARHAEIGAQMAERAGSSPMVVALIREHHNAPRRAPQTEFEKLLAALQKADESA